MAVTWAGGLAMAANRSIRETLTIGTLGAGALALFAVDPALAYGGAGMMGGGTAGATAGFGFVGMLWPLLLLGGLLAVVYWAADSGTGGVGSSGSDAALDTLRERYARGEMTEDEFVERRRRLDR